MGAVLQPLETSRCIQRNEALRDAPGWLALVCRQQPVKFVLPRTNLGKRLRLPLVAELGRIRPEHLAHDLALQHQLATDGLDRLALDKICPADLRNRLHDQHPNLGSHDPWKPVWTLSTGGGRLDADHPENGVLIPRRNTLVTDQFARECRHRNNVGGRPHAKSAIQRIIFLGTQAAPSENQLLLVFLRRGPQLACRFEAGRHHVDSSPAPFSKRSSAGTRL